MRGISVSIFLEIDVLKVLKKINNAMTIIYQTSVTTQRMGARQSTFY
jgi:hypothetical protein